MTQRGSAVPFEIERDMNNSAFERNTNESRISESFHDDDERYHSEWLTRGSSNSNNSSTRRGTAGRNRKTATSRNTSQPSSQSKK